MPKEWIEHKAFFVISEAKLLHVLGLPPDTKISYSSHHTTNHSLEFHIDHPQLPAVMKFSNGFTIEPPDKFADPIWENGEFKGWDMWEYDVPNHNRFVQIQERQKAELERMKNETTTNHTP